MAVLSAQSTSGSNLSGTSLVITPASTATEDNLLIATVAWVNGTSDSSAATASITGWTEAVQQGRSGDGSNQMNGAAIFYKISDGTETNVTITLDATRKFAGWFMEISGNATSSVLDKTNSFDQASLVNSVQPGTTGTLTQANEIGICVAGWGDDGWSGNSWTTGESGWTEAGTMLQVAGSGTDVSIATAYKIVSATTALNPTHDVTGTNEDAICCIATFIDDGGGAGPVIAPLQYHHRHHNLAG